MNSDAIIDAILRREGGFVDHAADRGGPTKYGITKDTLSLWRKRVATVDEVRNLSEDEARSIYRKNYITAPRFDRINYPPLQALVVDCGVNHGVIRAVKWLQKLVAVQRDGVMGPVTLAAINQAHGEHLYARLLAERCRFFGQIITRDPSQAVFAAGWMARLAEFIEA